MPNRKKVNLQDALDIVESLPEDQQEYLIAIIHGRLIEQRRESLAESIKKAREEYKKGEAHRGTVDDLMNEIAE